MSSQDDTNLLKSIAASLIARDLEPREERLRMYRKARGFYAQGAHGSSAYIEKLEAEVERLEAQIEQMHEHDEESDLMHVSPSEYNVLLNLWVACAKDDGTSESQARYAEALVAANERLGDAAELDGPEA